MLIPLKLVRDQRLQQQLYDQLHDLILSGRLGPGSRMPSTRMMAEQFSISRVTVLLAYERLTAEGYLESRPAAGTFVAHRRPPGPGAQDTAGPYRCLGEGQAGSHAAVGCPDPSLFPSARWRGLMRGALDRQGAQGADEHRIGTPALREALAGWLSTSRGIAVTPDQIIPVKSRQQALHVAAHLTLTAGARTVVEDPCDAHAAATLIAERGELARVPVDADGIRTDHLPEGEIALAHVTPEHQRPLGVVMTLARRLALLDWAARTGAIVLEEDWEGEIRFGAMDIPSVFSLDKTGLVILMGGFRISLGPWIDLGFMVVPLHMVAAARGARWLIDDSRTGLEEIALTEFLSSGGYARHLHRLIKTYSSRRDTMVAALRRHFGADAMLMGHQAGLHLAWVPPGDLGVPADFAALARRCGLEATALPAERQPGLPGGHPILIGFGSLPERQIEARVARLSDLAGPRTAIETAD